MSGANTHLNHVQLRHQTMLQQRIPEECKPFRDIWSEVTRCAPTSRRSVAISRVQQPSHKQLHGINKSSKSTSPQDQCGLDKRHQAAPSQRPTTPATSKCRRRQHDPQRERDTESLQWSARGRQSWSLLSASRTRLRPRHRR